MSTDAKPPLAGAVGSAEFVEAECKVHLVSPLQGEHTLCGDAFDLGTDEPGYEWKPTSRRVVTCPNCARIIHECRGVRTQSPNEPQIEQ